MEELCEDTDDMDRTQWDTFLVAIPAFGMSRTARRIARLEMPFTVENVVTTNFLIVC